MRQGITTGDRINIRQIAGNMITKKGRKVFYDAASQSISRKFSENASRCSARQQSETGLFEQPVLRSGYLFHPVDRDGMRRSFCREDPREYRPYQNDADPGKQS